MGSKVKAPTGHQSVRGPSSGCRPHAGKNAKEAAFLYQRPSGPIQAHQPPPPLPRQRGLPRPLGDEAGELCPSQPTGSLLAAPCTLARGWNTKLFLFMIVSVGWPLSRQLVLSFEAILECTAPFIENRRQCAD